MRVLLAIIPDINGFCYSLFESSTKSKKRKLWILMPSKPKKVPSKYAVLGYGMNFLPRVH
jgi:hypothetical protein